MGEGVALRRPSPFSRRFGDFLPSPTKKSHRRLRLFPKHRTSPCRPSPEARSSPFRRTFFGSRAAILHSAFPRSRTRDAPSAEHFRLPALLCDFLLRRNSPPPARRASALPLRSPPRLPASATSTPCAAEFPPLSLPPNGSATYAPNLPCPIPGENLCNSPPAARPATPAALPSTLQHCPQCPRLSDARSAERLRTRDAPGAAILLSALPRA